MIDEKKIEEAAEKHMLEQFYSKGKAEYPIECGEIDRQCQKDFKAGIDWFKKNLWHDVKEHPKVDEKIIVAQNFNGKVSYDFTIQLSEDEYTWEDNASYYNFIKWCYLKDLI